ncbi:gamma-glutamylcyclotransferase, partial [Ruminococcaceae bacterium OttesenSCG-928-L11]|nr:gamma-glutamylcyclotransferase [Ruminococcaceae bacterium OttesenSCG-928-L11]
AEVVGSAQLEGYDLLFRGGRHGAVATVEQLENGKVPVLLWKLRPQDEHALDIYEGWPSFYRKEIRDIELNGQTVPAMVYIMNDGHEFGEPSDFYLDTIREGYESAGFDLDYLYSAVEKSTELAQTQDLYESEMLPEQQELDGMEFDEDGLSPFDMKWW